METSTYKGRATIIQEGLERLKERLDRFGLTPTSLFAPGAQQHYTFVCTDALGRGSPTRGVVKKIAVVADAIWIYLPDGEWLVPNMHDGEWDGTWVLKDRRPGSAQTHGVLELH